MPLIDIFRRNVGPFGTYDDITQVVKRGDLIEIKRTLIRHWVICESIDEQGVVWCYHVTPFRLMAKKKVFVRYQPLSDILMDDRESSATEGDHQGMDLCRVNNQERQTRQRGRTARPLDQVFADLEALKDKILEYELNGRNCEFYCTLLKYGWGWSRQVNSAMDTVQVAVTAPMAIAAPIAVLGGGIFAAVVVPTLALTAGTMQAVNVVRNRHKNIVNNENAQRQIRSIVNEHREAMAMAQRLNTEAMDMAMAQRPNTEAMDMAQRPNTEAMDMAMAQRPNTEAMDMAMAQRPNTEAMDMAQRLNTEAMAMAMAMAQGLNTEAMAIAQWLNTENARRKSNKRFMALIFTSLLFIIMAMVFGYYLGLSASSVRSDLEVRNPRK